jgi:hypothetical protein
MKRGDQKAYLEVTPHCPLSISICRVGRKTVIGPIGGNRTGITATRDLTRVVQMHEVAQDDINLSFMACSVEHSVLPLVARQMCKTISININNHYGLGI